MGNLIWVKKLITLYEESVNKGKKVPDVIIINSTKQVSASKRNWIKLRYGHNF